MKKIIISIILFHSLCVYVFSIIDTHGIEYEEDVISISIDYGKTFKNEARIINLNLLPSLGVSSQFTANLGLVSTFSLDKFIFDIYIFTGFSYYPFRKILSFSCGIGEGISMCALLNHFPYLLNVKMNIEIPIYEFNNLTIGLGVQHRNAVKLIGYIKSDSYYGIYNSYFFEIGYRTIQKTPPGFIPRH